MAEQDDIAREILAYLFEHPDARDTLEGIMEWWLLERNVRRQRDLVAAALQDLVDRNLVLSQDVRGYSESTVQLNPDKKTEIESYLKDQRQTG